MTPLKRPNSGGSDGIKLLSKTDQFENWSNCSVAECPIEQFVAAELINHKRGRLLASDVLEALNSWCELNGFEPVSRTKLGLALAQLRVKKSRSGPGGTTVYHGIELRGSNHADQAIA